MKNLFLLVSLFLVFIACNVPEVFNVSNDPININLDSIVNIDISISIEPKDIKIPRYCVLDFIYINSDSFIKDRTRAVYDADIDSSGNIYACVYQPTNQMIIYDKDLNYKYHTVGINTPHGVAVDALGDIYIATFSNGILYKFHPSTGLDIDWDLGLSNMDAFDNPLMLDFDQNNDFYLTDYFNGKIVKGNTDGNFLFSFSAPPDPEDTFWPHSIYVDHNGPIYVAERYVKGHVYTFDHNGNMLDRWDRPSEEFDPLMIRPISDKYFLVANYEDSKLYMYDKKGVLYAKIGERGEEPGQFLDVTTFVTRGDGIIYVFEENGNRIQKIDINHILQDF